MMRDLIAQISFFIKNSTVSNRSLILAMLFSGNIIHRFNNLAPIGETYVKYG